MTEIFDYPTGQETAPAGGGFLGVVIGIVRNNRDPQGLGRVKVELPWLADGTLTDWARVAVPMAGPGTGFFFLPEPDDEVLVAFEHGNPEVPYVVGALWNGKDRPPVTEPPVTEPAVTESPVTESPVTESPAAESPAAESPAAESPVTEPPVTEPPATDNDGRKGISDIRVIRSRSGHVIRLTDTDGEEAIEIVDKNAGNSIVISTKDNRITITAAADVVISAGGKLRLSGNGVEIVSEADVNIQAKSSLAAKSSGRLDIKGSQVNIN
ncbi:phage baseplate assembly protein V [Streptomyces sp. bgisy034]|uniref:phage baseplate assembly protein V n=1 Tax=Streptomyces sp. bgisy034 TaxID=3413774 RepID=UPI003EC13B59